MATADAEAQCEAILDEVASAVVVGRETLRTILAGFVGRGHVLLEDVPGTGKTLTARSLATALDLSFSRVQFTPDLLPTDVTGTHVFDERSGEFEFTEGPIFANVVLADEINRASPKTQAALLEAMEEGQVTVDGETRPLPDPFFVIATQNPVEQEGTFELPEAQKDRFIVKTSLGYPELEGELELIDRRLARRSQRPSANPVCTREAVDDVRAAPEDVHVEADVRRYVATVSRATREDARVAAGASPRGTQRLLEVSRAMAVLRGRAYVTPEDVQRAAKPVLAHRLVLTPESRVNDLDERTVIADILDEIEVPTVRTSPS